MKSIKNISLYIFFIIFLNEVQAQDFNLYNPSNELYLYSASSEGANGFRYNPAVLGLKHRLNITFNMFINNYKNKTYLDEADLLINSGIIGIGSRIFNDRANNQTITQFSGGLGFGSRSFCGGIGFDYIYSSSSMPLPVFTAIPKTSKFRYTFGLLYRPADFISLAFTFKTNETINLKKRTTEKYTIGAAIRPLKTDFLTLTGDFSFLPYTNNKIFDYRQIKAGTEIKILNGVYLNGNINVINNPDRKYLYTLGLRFDLPSASVIYNNTISKINNQNYSESYPLKTAGSHFSLTYNLERRKSIVPERKKILEITLSGAFQDYTTEDVFFGLLGSGKKSVHEVIADIDYASNDESVKGLLLSIYPLSSGRFEINSAIEELTNSIIRFKNKGKSVTAYFPQDITPGGYYIATFADKIIMPAEALFFYGLSLNIFNYNSFLEKYGIDLQTFYAGKYKLTFQGLLDSTTQEGKETINRILDIVYDKMLERIKTGRKISIDDKMAEYLSKPMTGPEALSLGLVDKLGWKEDAIEIAEKSSGSTNIVKDFNRSEWETQWGEFPQIAIVGVYSSITTGESEAPAPITLPIPFIGGGRSTGSETVVRQLEDAFSNPKVKAVVLRVDSGGGSALGSAEINAAIIRLKRKYKKPLIVSMGGAAASGGYYVSASADKIFSDELTITGSIGVFYAIPNLDSLMKQQRIKVEIFKRGEYSDIGSFYKELDQQETEIIQNIINFYYDRFILAITEGRKISKEEAEEVAQGRVWLGTDAFNKKLVDEIGGLYEAIQYCKQIAKIKGKYKLVYYAVPDGNKLNEIITGSVLSYFQHHLTDLLGLGQNINELPEIKY